MKKQFLLSSFLVFGMLFAACKQEEKTLREYMINSWQTTYIKIEMPTFQKSDSTSTFEDTFENNPERIVQSKYNDDGTFSTWSLNQKGEKYGNSEGTWKMKGDSLLIEFFYNGKDVKEAYQSKKIENGFQGKSKYDWDGDGEFDDLLIMKTKQIQLK